MSSGAAVWEYFDKKADNNNKAICKVCKKEYSCPGGTTSSLSGHLKQNIVNNLRNMNNRRIKDHHHHH